MIIDPANLAEKPDLSHAILLASYVHKNQEDKVGEPYVLHPIRAMLQMETEEEKIVAVLHDVIEDTEVTEEDLLRMGFSKNIVDAVCLLSIRIADGKKEPYRDFIERIKPNELARNVKIADIKDNLNQERLKTLSDNDFHRIDKYNRALAYLTDRNKDISILDGF